MLCCWFLSGRCFCWKLCLELFGSLACVKETLVDRELHSQAYEAEGLKDALHEKCLPFPVIPYTLQLLAKRTRMALKGLRGALTKPAGITDEKGSSHGEAKSPDKHKHWAASPGSGGTKRFLGNHSWRNSCQHLACLTAQLTLGFSGPLGCRNTRGGRRYSQRRDRS